MDTYGAGVVVLLFNQEGDILVGERKGAHGAGTVSLPGGKLEFMKTALEQASDELREETGIVIQPALIQPRQWLDNIWVDQDKGQQHWVTLFTEADCPVDQSPKVMEPNKCAWWRWEDPATLLSGALELFAPLKSFLVKYPWASWPRYRQSPDSTVWRP